LPLKYSFLTLTRNSPHPLIIFITFDKLQFLAHMNNIDKLIDQAFSTLKSTCGGVRNNYFGLVYLENEFGLLREKAIHQVAFGGNDYGVDGFHFDIEKKNLYIFQFDLSDSYSSFKTSLQLLIDHGFEAIFLNPSYDRNKNQILNQLRSCLIENRSVIKQIMVRFVFTGDPEEAERSAVLDKLREDLENKKYIIDKFFDGQQVSLIVEFRSFSGKVGSVTDRQKTYSYNIPLKQVFTVDGPASEKMYIGLIRLTDIYDIYNDMGRKFFERNIRFGLGSDEYVNRAILKTLKSIILEKKEKPGVFTFNHNGISLYSELLTETEKGIYQIVSPRLLNGAQTVTTLVGFIGENKDKPEFQKNREILNDIYILCKIITNAEQEFITSVTISNNRQNPVKPWQLHANDMIQLKLQDKFREDLKIAYERQENAFSDIDPEEEGIIDNRPVKLLKLAQTFLVSDGNLQRITNLSQVFEEDNIYKQVFSDSRLKADFRHILLCYKIQLRLPKLLEDIRDKGQNKYAFIPRARFLLWSLLCQAVLNDDELDTLTERFGCDMTMTADFTAHLSYLATSKCRLLISELVSSDKYRDKAAEDNYSFLKTNAAFSFCMNVAMEKWKWDHKKLK
jgi:hypothetical protein